MSDSDNPIGVWLTRATPENQQETVLWDPQRPYASHLVCKCEMKRWSDPHGDVGRPVTAGPLSVGDANYEESPSNSISEIPCRVSSDLHEWRNDLGTVSTGDSAKLQYE
jgi:hypothetical protein